MDRLGWERYVNVEEAVVIEAASERFLWWWSLKNVRWNSLSLGSGPMSRCDGESRLPIDRSSYQNPRRYHPFQQTKIIYNNLLAFSWKKNIVFYIKIFLCKRDRTISFPILSFKRIYNIKAFPLLFQLLPRWKSFYACKRTSKRNEMDSF